MAQRLTSGRAFRRDRARFERGTPEFERPRATPDTLTATWVGHSTVLLQLGGVTVLTDPIWSARASPTPLLGPKRRVPAAVRFADLPPIDVALVSHNHYDHLDARTVRRLRRRDPAMPWVSPLGVTSWLHRRGVRHAWELDWWDTLHVGGARVTAVPARHFSARGIRDRMATLWCGYVVEADGWRVWFCGDSGMHSEWESIGARLGPFDAMLIPVGAYEPRWFMEPVHMTPEEAVGAYDAVERGSGRRSEADGAKKRGGAPGRGGPPPTGNIPPKRQPPVMIPIHWGTFKLTDEPLDEPPARTRAAWAQAGHEPGALWLLRHGETRRLRRGA
jgi:N-acyl-phosphatidylethanolamine-hydrolysing phospholipase D